MLPAHLELNAILIANNIIICKCSTVAEYGSFAKDGQVYGDNFGGCCANGQFQLPSYYKTATGYNTNCDRDSWHYKEMDVFEEIEWQLYKDPCF